MASCQSPWSSNKNSFWIAASICIRLIGPCVGGPVGRLTHSRKAMLVPFLRCHGYKFGGFFIGIPIDSKVGQRSACGLCQLYIVHDRAQIGLSLVSGRSLALSTTGTSKRLLWQATPLAAVIVHRDCRVRCGSIPDLRPFFRSRAMAAIAAARPSTDQSCFPWVHVPLILRM
jgi:hypothetical protein